MMHISALAACAAFSSAAAAFQQGPRARTDAALPVVIDSHGNAVRSSAMLRREDVRLHEFSGDSFLENGTASNTTSASSNDTRATKGKGDSDTSTSGRPAIGGPAATGGSETEPAAAAAPTTALTRTDLNYNYVEEKLPGACDSHYEFQGLLSNDECAARCYSTYGCTRFSAGGCDLGCRISKPKTNNPSGVALPPDGQCPTTDGGSGAGCVVYQLTFFHAVDQPGSCSAHFELHSSAQNKAECAHACKNTPGCTKFTAEPNCMSGCRISKCNSNAASMPCPADSQCNVTTDSGCTAYEVYR